ncbi:MAG: alpha/beta fold hydrolase [Rhizobiaceae bacterium]
MTLQFKIAPTFNAPVFAIHSSASNNTQWKHLVQELDARFDVIAPNLPGYGDLAITPDFSETGVAITAAPIIREIEKQRQPVHLVGHSQGGGVALKIALMRPALIKSLTLYEPATFHFLKSGDRTDKQMSAAINQVAGLLTASCQSDRPDLGMKQFIDFWNGDGAWNQSPPALRKKLAEQATIVMSDFARGFEETWTLSDLEQLEIPTLMLMGMASPKVAQHVATKITRAIPNARMAMLPGLGHMAPVFQPQWINPRIREHIAGVERPAVPCSWPQKSAA